MNTPIPKSKSRASLREHSRTAEIPPNPSNQSRNLNTLNLRLNQNLGLSLGRSTGLPNRAQEAGNVDDQDPPSAAITTGNTTTGKYSVPPTPHEIADSLHFMTISKHDPIFCKPIVTSNPSDITLPNRPEISPLTPFVSLPTPGNEGPLYPTLVPVTSSSPRTNNHVAAGRQTGTNLSARTPVLKSRASTSALSPASSTPTRSFSRNESTYNLSSPLASPGAAGQPKGRHSTATTPTSSFRRSPGVRPDSRNLNGSPAQSGSSRTSQPNIGANGSGAGSTNGKVNIPKRQTQLGTIGRDHLPDPTLVEEPPSELERARMFFLQELEKHRIFPSVHPKLPNETTVPNDSIRSTSSLNIPSADGDVAVIIQDACYSHRYSRPRTSRSLLGVIVERPERLRASVLGIAAAYVRLNGCYSSPDENLHSPDHPNYSQSETSVTPPFRLIKSTRSLPITSKPVVDVHGKEWMADLVGLCRDAEYRLGTCGRELEPQPASIGGRLHEGDLYLNGESRAALEGALGGVCDGVDFVCQPRLHDQVSDLPQARSRVPPRAFVAIRPPGHHCGDNTPGGFCWVNNVHVGIQYAARTHDITHAVIIDFDLHHGDGSQTIAWATNTKAAQLSASRSRRDRTRSKAKPESDGELSSDDDGNVAVPVGYFSLHDINSYPCEEGDIEKVQQASICLEGSHGQTIWNVHLERWRQNPDTFDKEDETRFWDLYNNKYYTLIKKAREFLERQAERNKKAGRISRGMIFLSAGFDASEWESEGMRRHGVGVLTGFYERITRDVVSMASADGNSDLGVVGILSVLEGGYSDRALSSGVLSHLTGLCNVGNDLLAEPESHELKNSTLVRSKGGCRSWWSAAALDELFTPTETAPPSVDPSASSTASSVSARGMRRANRIASQSTTSSSGPPSTSLSTYSSPTQSYANKVVDPSKLGVQMQGQGRRVSWVNLREVAKAERKRLVTTETSTPEDSELAILETSGTTGTITPGESPTVEHSPKVQLAAKTLVPEFSWAVGAVSLANLLLPEDNPTTSVTFEELSLLQRARKARIQKGDLCLHQPIVGSQAVSTTSTVGGLDLDSVSVDESVVSTGSTSSRRTGGTTRTRQTRMRITSPDVEIPVEVKTENLAVSSRAIRSTRSSRAIRATRAVSRDTRTGSIDADISTIRVKSESVTPKMGTSTPHNMLSPEGLSNRNGGGPIGLGLSLDVLPTEHSILPHGDFRYTTPDSHDQAGTGIFSPPLIPSTVAASSPSISSTVATSSPPIPTAGTTAPTSSRTRTIRGNRATGSRVSPQTERSSRAAAVAAPLVPRRSARMAEAIARKSTSPETTPDPPTAVQVNKGDGGALDTLAFGVGKMGIESPGKKRLEIGSNHHYLDGAAPPGPMTAPLPQKLSRRSFSSRHQSPAIPQSAPSSQNVFPTDGSVGLPPPPPVPSIPASIKSSHRAQSQAVREISGVHARLSARPSATTRNNSVSAMVDNMNQMMGQANLSSYGPPATRYPITSTTTATSTATATATATATTTAPAPFQRLAPAPPANPTEFRPVAIAPSFSHATPSHISEALAAASTRADPSAQISRLESSDAIATEAQFEHYIHPGVEKGSSGWNAGTRQGGKENLLLQEHIIGPSLANTTSTAVGSGGVDSSGSVGTGTGTGSRSVTSASQSSSPPSPPSKIEVQWMPLNADLKAMGLGLNVEERS